MSFVLYRSPDPRPGHRGESLRTRSAAEAWSRIRRFLADHTDDPPPRSAVLTVEAAVDDDGSAEVVADSIAASLGAATPVASSSGDERGWEWKVDPTSPDAVTQVVGWCAHHEHRPRIHINPAVRRHGSPKTPQVWATIAYEIALRGPPDTHRFRPGWGQSQLRAFLGFNEVWLVLHLPFAELGPPLFDILDAIDAALQLTLDRKRLRTRAV